jgi:hypothetical protein
LGGAALSVAGADGCFNSSSVFGRNLIISTVFRLRSRRLGSGYLRHENNVKSEDISEICFIDRDVGADRQRQSQCPLDEEKHILKVINGIEE